MLHRIRRQILDLELPREAGAAASARAAGRVFQEKVLPMLDRIFDDLAPEGRYLRIERLEVDLGRLSEAGFEQNFAEQCAQAIARAVQQHQSDLFAEAPAPGVADLDPADRSIEIAQFFLENGTLPWFAAGMKLDDLLPEVLTAAIKAPAASRAALLPLLRRRPSTLLRFFRQFKQAPAWQLLEKLLALPDGMLRETANDVQKALPAQVFDAAAQVSLAQTVFQHIEQNPAAQTGSDGKVFAAFIVRTVLAEERPPRRQTTDAAAKATPATMPPTSREQTQPTTPQQTAAQSPTAKGTTSQNAAAQSADTVQAQAKTPQQTAPQLAATTTQNPAEQPSNPSQTQTAETSPVDQQPQPHPAKPPAVNDAPARAAAALFQGAYPVENAGLVLLAPYFPAFFEALGLLSGGQNFRDTEAQERALHLLHFLSEGQEHPEEPQLLFPKILCGLPPEYPAPRDLDLSEVEKAECDNLLQAVVDNWPALKNTGPDGLRHAFLRRTGLFGWQESRQSWVLRVERLGQDILLERLPWGFSVIKLPWMQEMIQVEW